MQQRYCLEAVLAQKIVTCVLGCMSLSTLLGMAPPLQASESPKSSSSRPATFQYNPPIPPSLGAPKGRTGGGASRGTCAQHQAMQAVLPRNTSRAYELTVSEHPTFWFYLPDRPNPETRLEFVVQDAADQYVYKTVFNQPNAIAGLIRITLPEQSPALASNAMYSWTLSIQCDPKHPSQMAFIRGGIQTVAIAAHPESAAFPFPTSSKTNNPEVIAQRYAQQGFWYDAMTILAEALQTQPVSQSTAQLWQDLLGQSGLTILEPPSMTAKRSTLIQIKNTALVP
jgi:Domain of Unknown Function (DUF928)